MRDATAITSELIASGLSPTQTALLMELVLSMSTGLSGGANPAEPPDRALLKRRARDRKRKAMLPPNWGSMTAYVFKRDCYTCVYCGDEPEALHCDHIIPLSRGGLNEFDNLAAACPPCNLDKGSKLFPEWKCGCIGA